MIRMPFVQRWRDRASKPERRAQQHRPWDERTKARARAIAGSAQPTRILFDNAPGSGESTRRFNRHGHRVSGRRSTVLGDRF